MEKTMMLKAFCHAVRLEYNANIPAEQHFLPYQAHFPDRIMLKRQGDFDSWYVQALLNPLLIPT